MITNFDIFEKSILTNWQKVIQCRYKINSKERETYGKNLCDKNKTCT